MIKTFVYKNDTYHIEEEVRKAIFNETRTMHPAAPETYKKRIKFWADLEVEYTEEADPEPSIDEVREAKLNELNSNFELASKESHCMSSLGFEIDANDVADRNVRRLIEYFPVGVETVEFCDYNNIMHDLTVEQLKILAQEIVINGQYLYKQKWSKRDAINAAETIEEIENIDTQFQYMIFKE